MADAEVLQRLRDFQALPRRHGDDHTAWMLVRLAARLAELEMLAAAREKKK